MKILWKKYKFFLIPFFILITLYVIAISWHNGTQRGLREFYPLEKSSNKAASDEFIEANVYYSYIEMLHPFFDYDSVIMKPFMSRMDSHFQRGKALLPKDSIEDILWWVFLYTDRYALMKTPRNDKSLSYKNLSPKVFTILHDKVYTMIERFPNGVNNFKLERLEKFTFRAYTVLVDFFYGQYPLKYNPKDGKQTIQYRMDRKAKKRLEKILHDYPLVKKKYLNDLSSPNNKQADSNLLLDYKIDMVNMAFDIIFHEVYINHKKLPQKVCTSKEAEIVMTYSDSLIEQTDFNKEVFERIFDKENTNTLAGFGHLVINCTNLQPEVRNIYNKIDKLNKEKYGEKR